LEEEPRYFGKDVLQRAKAYAKDQAVPLGIMVGLYLAEDILPYTPMDEYTKTAVLTSIRYYKAEFRKLNPLISHGVGAAHRVLAKGETVDEAIKNEATLYTILQSLQYWQLPLQGSMALLGNRVGGLPGMAIATLTPTVIQSIVPLLAEDFNYNQIGESMSQMYNKLKELNSFGKLGIGYVLPTKDWWDTFTLQISEVLDNLYETSKRGDMNLLGDTNYR
jgi:hypothetical protein